MNKHDSSFFFFAVCEFHGDYVEEHSSWQKGGRICIVSADGNPYTVQSNNWSPTLRVSNIASQYYTGSIRAIIWGLGNNGYLITLLLLFFCYCFSRRQRITPRIALPPPTRTAYSRSSSFSQQSGVYSRSSSFDQQTSGASQQRSESLKQQKKPAAPKRPDTYASERALEDRIVCISFFPTPIFKLEGKAKLLILGIPSLPVLASLRCLVWYGHFTCSCAPSACINPRTLHLDVDIRCGSL